MSTSVDPVVIIPVLGLNMPSVGKIWQSPFGLEKKSVEKKIRKKKVSQNPEMHNFFFEEFFWPNLEEKIPPPSRPSVKFEGCDMASKKFSPRKKILEKKVLQNAEMHN